MRRYTTRDLWVARVAHVRAAISVLGKILQATWRGIRHPEFRSLIKNVGRVAWPLCIFICVPLLFPFLGLNDEHPAVFAPALPLAMAEGIREFIYPFWFVLAAVALGVVRWMFGVNRSI